jgi:pimeloyl-ACP methyl ester carboxylesterase
LATNASTELAGGAGGPDDVVFGRPFTVDTARGAMAGRAHGPAGPPDLVFLHANGFCGSTYAPLLAPLGAGGARVVSLDLRGHGRTRLPADPDRQRSWHGFRDDVAAALRALAPDGAVLAGHSMGATTAILTAAVPGAQVRGLVLFDPVLAPAAFYLYARMPWVFATWRRHFPMAAAALRRRATFESRADALARWQDRGAFKGWAEGFLEGYAADGLTEADDGGVRLSCAPAFEAACFAGQAHDPHAALRRVGAPIRLLRGGRHSTCSDAGVRAVRAAGGAVERVEGTSHFLPMQAPAVAVTALRAALAGDFAQDR